MIFIDESGSNRAMARVYGRSPRGKRVIDDVPKKRGKNLTILGAISLAGVETAMVIEGSTDQKVFTAFICELLIPVLKPGDVVVMDNLSSHKVHGIRQAIEATGASLLYLPPYSPELNPIEKAWAKLKSFLRTVRPRSLQQLIDAIADAIDSITPDDCFGWFTHCGYGESF